MNFAFLPPCILPKLGVFMGSGEVGPMRPFLGEVKTSNLAFVERKLESINFWP
jgi:hypothetical protein